MNYRALALGAALGFVFALSPSCGTAKTCDATNCAGCCDTAGACQTASQATCGASGQACKACTGTEVCSGGLCQAGTGGGAGGGTGGSCTGFCAKPSGGCGTDPCGNGCCIPNDPFGRCNLTPSQALCGKNGATCSACNTGTTCGAVTGGSECSGGTGGGSGGTDAGIGTACAGDSDCGAGFACKTQTNKLLDGGTFATYADGGAVTAVAYQDGYCTKRCTGNAQCGGSGNTCQNFPLIPGGVSGETERICVAGCQTDSTVQQCRDGYSCLSISSSGNAGMCFVDPSYPNGVIGSACTTSTDCGAGWTASCIPETFQGQPTGFAGGYCQADCTNATATDYCGSPLGLCVGFSDGSGYCYEKCGNTDGGTVGETAGQGTCRRSGYVCWGVFNDPTLGLCAGDCRSKSTATQPCGSQTANGFTCQTSGENTGYCCKAATDGGSPDCFGVL